MSALMVFKNNLLRPSYGRLAKGGRGLDMRKTWIHYFISIRFRMKKHEVELKSHL